MHMLINEIWFKLYRIVNIREPYLTTIIIINKFYDFLITSSLNNYIFNDFAKKKKQFKAQLLIYIFENVILRHNLLKYLINAKK